MSDNAMTTVTPLEQKIVTIDESIFDTSNIEKMIDTLKTNGDDDKETIEKFIDEWYSLTINKIRCEQYFVSRLINCLTGKYVLKTLWGDVQDSDIDSIEQFVEEIGLSDEYNKVIDAANTRYRHHNTSPAAPIIPLDATVQDKIDLEHNYQKELAVHYISHRQLATELHRAIRDFKRVFVEHDRTKTLIKNAKSREKQLKTLEEKCRNLKNTVLLGNAFESDEILKQLLGLVSSSNDIVITYKKNNKE